MTLPYGAVSSATVGIAVSRVGQRAVGSLALDHRRDLIRRIAQTWTFGRVGELPGPRLRRVASWPDRRGGRARARAVPARACRSWPTPRRSRSRASARTSHRCASGSCCRVGGASGQKHEITAPRSAIVRCSASMRARVDAVDAGPDHRQRPAGRRPASPVCAAASMPGGQSRGDHVARLGQFGRRAAGRERRPPATRGASRRSRPTARRRR